MRGTIDKFSDDFRFLSNFSNHTIFNDKILWQTVEHYYQAMKTLNDIDRARIWSAETPGQAKRMGSEVELRSNWDLIKFEIMEHGVQLKFDQNEDIKRLLVSTQGYKLIEGNTWHDNIWGDCKCEKCENIQGDNILGKILMRIRRRFLYE